MVARLVNYRDLKLRKFEESDIYLIIENDIQNTYQWSQNTHGNRNNQNNLLTCTITEEIF